MKKNNKTKLINLLETYLFSEDKDERLMTWMEIYRTNWTVKELLETHQKYEVVRK